MAPINYSKWDDLDAESEGENFAPAALPKNAIKPCPARKRCRLLELPAELRNKIWKEALTLDEEIPFHRLKQPDSNFFTKKIKSPSSSLRLTCKQIHSEVKDMVFKVNTFKVFASERWSVSTLDPLLVASKSPFWSKIGNFEFFGTFGASRREASFRIRKLHVCFERYKEDDMLLKHVDYFSCLKVEDKIKFTTVSLKSKSTPEASQKYKRTLDMVAVQTFDKMMWPKSDTIMIDSLEQQLPSSPLNYKLSRTRVDCSKQRSHSVCGTIHDSDFADRAGDFDSDSSLDFEDNLRDEDEKRRKRNRGKIIR